MYWQIDDGTGNNRVYGYRNQASEQVIFAGITATINDLVILTGNTADGLVTRLVGGWKVNDAAASLNGAAAVSDAACSAPPGLTTLRIGDATSNRSLNGHIRQIAYYPTRLANARLQEITA
jgi:predicted ATP-dependent serine protease